MHRRSHIDASAIATENSPESTDEQREASIANQITVDETVKEVGTDHAVQQDSKMAAVVNTQETTDEGSLDDRGPRFYTLKRLTTYS